MSDITRLRWSLKLSGNDHRCCEKIVNEACVPVADSLSADKSVDALYVSKHGPHDVWLTLICSTADSARLINVIDPFVAAFNPTQSRTSDASQEELLGSDCEDFRHALTEMTAVALSVHRQSSLADHQRALIKIGLQDRMSRTLLQPYLTQRSPAYASLTNPERFWAGLGSNCLKTQKTDCVHWLYNIILGFDWKWNVPEAAIIQYLGLS